MQDEIKSAIISSRKIVLEYKKLNRALEYPLQINKTAIPGWGGSSSILGYVDIVKRVLNKEIVVYKFPHLGIPEPIDACVICYTHLAEIYVKRDRNYCWSRFLVAKELCHVFISDENNSTKLTFDEVSSLISDLLNDAVREERADLMAEYIAYLAAIELLFPPEFVRDAENMINNGSSILDIAQKYKIPRLVAEYRLQREAIKTMYKEIYESIEYKSLEFPSIVT